MSGKLIFWACLFIFVVFLIILYYIKKNKINIKYSVIWFLLFGVLLIFLIIPGFLEKITKLSGFDLASNMIFSLLIGVLVIINIYFTKIISSQDKKIRNLIQEVSLLKGDKNE